MIDMENIVKITQHSSPGIGGEIQGRDYTILILNYLPRLCREAVADMQKHLETDESFVLLQGRATMFVTVDIDSGDALEVHQLEVGKVYTVPKGVWHTQIMTEDAKILLIESLGTVVENSPRRPLTESQKDIILNSVL